MTNNTTAPALTDDEIWTKFVYQVGDTEYKRVIGFARALLTSPRAAGLPNLIEKIAEQWDGCFFDAPGGCDIDIGEAIRAAAKRLDAAPAAPVAEAKPDQNAELASMTRMFHAACADLGLINEALGLDPDDGGAEPILDAIQKLKDERDQWADAGYAAQAVAADGASTQRCNLGVGCDEAGVCYASAHGDASQCGRAAVSPATADERAAFVSLIGYERPETEGCAVDVWDSHRTTWSAAIEFARASQAAAPAEAREPLVLWKDGTGMLWDTYSHGKWMHRVVSPHGWDAHGVAQHLYGKGYAGHLEVRAVWSGNYAVPADAGEAVAPSADLIARCRELLELSDHGESEQTALRALANAYRRDISPRDRRAMATSHTHLEAVKFVLDAAAQGAQGGKGGEA